MAAGRGECFRSFADGLKRNPADQVPCRRQPGRGRGRPGPGRRPKAAPNPAGTRGNYPARHLFHPRKNFLERLPSEILIKILSYLDASALLCVSHVNKLFNRLTGDNVMWYKIYMSEFGNIQKWNLKSKGDVASDLDGLKMPAGYWKQLYFTVTIGQEMSKWKRHLRHISPYTGLPSLTEWILRNWMVNWELTVCDWSGWESTLKQSLVYFSESSAIVCWRGGCWPPYSRISYMQLHGVKSEELQNPQVNNRWRSLIFQMDMKTEAGRFIGKDKMVKLMLLTSGFIIGIWRGRGTIAFIMVSLHFHRLVEKSLLGTPACPYSESVDRPPATCSNPAYVLQSYTLHIVLHNPSTVFMSGQFSHLRCHPADIRNGLMKLNAINMSKVWQHRSLSGNIKFPWRTEDLEGSVDGCCIMTLTLLDISQKPFWCVTHPVCIKIAKNLESLAYSGEHYVIDYHSPDGQVKMLLVWMNEEKQFFLISLCLFVSVARVKKHFSG
ncbi:F-box only protein 15-like [Thalassophryne amazonica]|uniref:F-box only protein 15-like n=1 Tax=Thalassophryne amazonica TaxID=390379 RepID=UPI001470E9A0|nr:F-box only protein 15-like [Thalassophryne amazonica]